MASQGLSIGRRRFAAGLLASVAIVPVVRAITPAGPPAQVPKPPGGGQPLPPITYDQGMGATDATGLVKAFPLRAGAKRFFVDTRQGKSQFNGLSPFAGYRLNGSGPDHQVGATGRGAADTSYGPAASYEQAVDQLYGPAQNAIGEGWQVLLAEGQSFAIGATRTAWSYLRGRSIAYPFCLQSYDPRDPLNEAKHGRAGTTGQQARPVLTLAPGGAWPSVERGDAVAYDNWAFRGLALVNKTGVNQSLGFVYCVNNLLVENCIFDAVQLVLEDTNPHPGFTVSKNIIVRRIASFGQYDLGGGHACGLFSTNADITVEDSVFYHCGWKIGVDRNTPVAGGGPDIFKHCVYIHGGNGTRANLHRLVMIDGSASGLSLRGSHLCHHNVIVDCPTPDFNSGASASDAESPDGVLQQAYCHLIVGGADINDALPRGQGFSSSDGAPGSFYAYNLFVNNPKFGQVNNNWMQILGNVANQRSHQRIFGNRAFAFAPADRALVVRGAFPETVKVDTSDNVSQDGTPTRTSQIYQALGFASKEALVSAMIADPMRDWSYLLLAEASKGFGFDFSRVPQAG